MAVQVAANVCELDQPGQLAAARRRQLAAVLAQLRLDVVEVQPRVQLLLRGEGLRALLAVYQHPVLGHVHPLAHRRFAQRGVVRAGAGEVLQQVAELCGLGNSQIDRDTGVGDAPGAGLAR